MEQLLQSLKGKTLDDNSIADLMKAMGSGSLAAPEVGRVHHNQTVNDHSDIHSVDDLVIASQAAEMEFQSIKRYFSSNKTRSNGGVDGLADEDVSSDSDDEIATNHKKEVSVLDAILSKNSMKTVEDDTKEDAGSDLDTTVDIPAEQDLSNVPSTVVVPFSAKRISLGKVQSVVDGLVVIAEFGILDKPSEAERVAHAKIVAACDIESLVFLDGSEPLTVIGMIVDILGTVKNPLHLVLVTNKQLVSQTLIGARVCTFDSHSRMVEVDEIGGTTVIRGVPQICDDECDDDNVSADEETEHLPIQNTPEYTPYRPQQHVTRAQYPHAHQNFTREQYQHGQSNNGFVNYRSAQPVMSTAEYRPYNHHYISTIPPPPPPR